jgi:hypothetical protein
MGIPPWLMWGSTQIVSVVQPTGATAQSVASGQLARIDYARPERWCFLFGARILQAASPGGALSVDVDVAFDVTIGIGRTSLVISSFNDFGWKAYATGGAGSSLIWCTQVQTPSKSFSDNNVYITDEIVAQSLNCNVRASIVASQNVLTEVDLEITAAFSPATHIRPEWFKDGRFTAGEDYGL